MMSVRILYEQALNETVRACLRLEALFKHIRDSKDETPISSFLEIIGVLDRPDLKNKLTTLLSNQKQKLEQLLTHPEIDHSTLEETLDEATGLIECIHQQHHLANDLIQHPFFKTLRQQMIHPGGLLECNAPAYQLWCSQPKDARILQFESWHETLLVLEQAVSFILKMIRASQSLQEKHTESGFYQKKLDPSQDIQLIRIQVPKEVLPEISAGAHLLVLHFTLPQFSQNDYSLSPASHVPFSLACCSEIF